MKQHRSKILAMAIGVVVFLAFNLTAVPAEGKDPIRITLLCSPPLRYYPSN